MKRKILFIAAMAMGAVAMQSVLTSCSSKTTLKVYNWGEYIQRDLIDAFEEEYDCKVKYTTFNSNEIAISQMENNSFDVVIPSDYAIEELASKNQLLELDWSKIYGEYAAHENLELEVSDPLDAMKEQYTDYVNTLTDKLKNDDPTRPFDFYKYAAPYFSGNVGIVYNKDVISEETIAEKGWDIVRDGSYRVAYYDSSRDGFMPPLKELGKSMNTTDEKDIDAALEWLKEQKRLVGSNLTYLTDEVLDKMINGYFDVALVYSGDACYIMSESDYNLDFYVPTNGTNVWVDGMVIPKKAKQVDLAHQFIAFMTRAESGYENALEVCYTPTTKKALDLFLNDEDFVDYKDYYSYEIQELDEIYRYDESIKNYMKKKWVEARNS